MGKYLRHKKTKKGVRTVQIAGDHFLVFVEKENPEIFPDYFSTEDLKVLLEKSKWLGAEGITIDDLELVGGTTELKTKKATKKKE